MLVKKYIKIFLIFLLIVSMWLVYLGGSIYAYSKVDDRPQSDVAIVLGAAIWKNAPSPVFKERINHAIFLYKSGVIGKIIFTGGVGEGELQAESEVARNYALKHGITQHDILIETKSTNTQQNLSEAKKLMYQHSLNTVIVISDPLHMKRAMSIAKDLELNAASSPTPTTRYKSLKNKTKFLLREMYFYQQYLLKWV